MRGYLTGQDFNQRLEKYPCPTMGTGRAIRLKSKHMNIWWGINEESCKKNPDYQEGEAIYTVDELKALEGHTPEMVSALEEFSRVYREMVEDVPESNDGEPRPKLMWQPISPENEAIIASTLKRCGYVRQYHPFTDSIVWFSDNKEVCKRRPFHQPGEAVYTLDELLALTGHTPQMIEAVNEARSVSKRVRDECLL